MRHLPSNLLDPGDVIVFENKEAPNDWRALGIAGFGGWKLKKGKGGSSGYTSHHNYIQFDREDDATGGNKECKFKVTAYTKEGCATVVLCASGSKLPTRRAQPHPHG